VFEVTGEGCPTHHSRAFFSQSVRDRDDLVEAMVRKVPPRRAAPP
jgi:hypothetical protein